MSHELSKHKDTKFSALNTKYLTESLDLDMLFNLLIRLLNLAHLQMDSSEICIGLIIDN